MTDEPLWWMHRVAVSLGSGLLVAVIAARTVLPVAVRVLAKHATPELYQLTVVAFCLCSGWLSGYMVNHQLCCCCASPWPGCMCASSIPCVHAMMLLMSVRVPAKHAASELFWLTLVAFCLCSAWLSGYMARHPLCCCRIFSLCCLHVGALASWRHCEVCCKDYLEGRWLPRFLGC